MASIGENLRTFLVGSTAIQDLFDDVEAPNVVAQTAWPEDPPMPRIWYGRAGQEEPRDLDGCGGLVFSLWDIECQSVDLDEVLAIADAVKARLDAHSGAMGDQVTQGVFVTDHDDDYVWKSVGADDGINASALQVQIIFNS